jgi:fructan beta-fructosidase
MKPLLNFHLAVLVSLASVVTSFSAVAPSASTYREQWRPQFHFTPATNWMNDPNGMVFYDGEYHLFYQYNPWGNQWGHMSWGHAVSRDLVHWEHLPVALFEENDVMIFSGSAVVDWKNTSGFGRDGKPPMVAIYTGHYTKKPLQNQLIAYSNDRGRTWTKFAGNPVLDIGAKDFRDPKVMWHEPAKRWVMTVAWPVERQVRFYASPNLKHWTHLSDFGPAGSTNGIWECPDLFPLRLEGRRDAEKWALIVNVGSGAPAGGSGCQYFVGNFDGQRFTPDSPNPPPLWADFGADFYAAVSWSDIPRRDGRRLWLGWMSNWQYANDVPTAPWRSAMSVPRELLLRNARDGWRLLQSPARELEKLRGKRHRLGRSSLVEAGDWLKGRSFTSELLDVEAEFAVPPHTAPFGFIISNRAGEETRLRLDPAAGRLSLDRTRSGRIDFSGTFSGVHHAPVALRDGRVSLRILLDTSSIEVFANGGEAVLTDLILPTGNGHALGMFTEGAGPRVTNLRVHELKSAWR